MSEDLQTMKYHTQIEEEDDYIVEETEEELITIDFDNGVAIQEGVIVGEGLLDSMAEVLDAKVQSNPLIAKNLVTAIEAPEETVFMNVVETPEGYDEAAREAEEREKAIKANPVPQPTYRDALTDLFVDTITNRAVRALMDAHVKLENDVYDELQKKHSNKMGKAYQFHQAAILKSIDQKMLEIRKSYGYTGRVSYEHIPEWSKPFIEDYFKNFVSQICSLVEDID